MHALGEDTLRRFGRLASDLPGELVIAVVRSPGEDPLVLGTDGPFHAWSTIKVPVLVALLTLVHRAALAPQQLDLARRAISESDNAAILELFVLLEGLAGGSPEAASVIERLFRVSGDPRTHVTLAPPPPGAITPFGQTGWTAGDSSRFFAALAAGRLLGADGTRHVLGLMERIVPEQRWGLGTAQMGIAFKGGWGPEADGSCLVRQCGVVVGSGTAISLIARPPVGEDSFEMGVGMLNRAAAWLASLL